MTDTTLLGAVYDAHETLLVGGAVARLTKTRFQTRSHVFITCESGSVRFWLDEADPTSSEGHLLGVGDVLLLDRVDQLDGFRVISPDGAAVLQCSYGKTR